MIEAVIQSPCTHRDVTVDSFSGAECDNCGAPLVYDATSRNWLSKPSKPGITPEVEKMAARLVPDYSRSIKKTPDQQAFCHAFKRILDYVLAMTPEQREEWMLQNCTEYVSRFGTVTIVNHPLFSKHSIKTQ